MQWVIRPMSDEHHDFRGYAGQVAGGEWRAGDEVVVLPSGLRTTSRRSRPMTGRSTSPSPASRSSSGSPTRWTSRAATCSAARATSRSPRAAGGERVLDERAPVQTGARLAVKHTTRWARAILDEVVSVLDVETPRPLRRRLSRPERHRADPPPPRRAAARRPVRREPHDRRVRPRRRGNERDGRGRHGLRRNGLTFYEHMFYSEAWSTARSRAGARSTASRACPSTGP